MIIAKDEEHQKEIKSHGNNFDLNHIDISNVTDMNCLFAVIKTKFKSIQNLKR